MFEEKKMEQKFNGFYGIAWNERTTHTQVFHNGMTFQSYFNLVTLCELTIDFQFFSPYVYNEKKNLKPSTTDRREEKTIFRFFTANINANTQL